MRPWSPPPGTTRCIDDIVQCLEYVLGWCTHREGNFFFFFFLQIAPQLSAFALQQVKNVRVRVMHRSVARMASSPDCENTLFGETSKHTTHCITQCVWPRFYTIGFDSDRDWRIDQTVELELSSARGSAAD